MGDFIARVVLSVFYFTVFMPFGLGVRFLSDPLRVKLQDRDTFWLDREPGDHTTNDSRRQF